MKRLLVKGSIEEVQEMKDQYPGYELYLSKEDINKNIHEVCDKIGDYNVSVIHTPHLKYDQYQEGLEYCDELASELDSSIVCHSSYIKPKITNKVDSIDFSRISNEYGIENHIGLSLSGIKRNILKEGHNIVLDIAHLYITNPGLYERNLAYLLHEYPDKISNIHLCGSTKEKDHFQLDKGSLDVKRTMESILKSKYNKDVVLEVSPEDREKSFKIANKMFDEILSY